MQKFHYPKTSETVSANKRLDIIAVLNQGGKPLRKRLEQRGIKIPDIKRATSFTFDRVSLENKAVLGSYRKFNFVMKDNKKEFVNLTK